MWNTFFGKILTTVLVSMVPVLELRAAIPIAVAGGISLPVAILASFVGNLIPVPFIIIFTKKIFMWLRNAAPKLDTFITKLEERAEKKSDIVQKYAFWGLFILVAIPLPGTGAWTGALVAAMMNMRLKSALPSIALGVAVAGAIVTFVTYGADKLLF